MPPEPVVAVVEVVADVLDAVVVAEAVVEAVVVAEVVVAAEVVLVVVEDDVVPVPVVVVVEPVAVAVLVPVPVPVPVPVVAKPVDVEVPVPVPVPVLVLATVWLPVVFDVPPLPPLFDVVLPPFEHATTNATPQRGPTVRKERRRSFEVMLIPFVLSGATRVASPNANGHQ